MKTEHELLEDINIDVCFCKWLLHIIAAILLAILGVLVLTSRGHAAGLPVQGNGAWVQKNNINNPWLWSDKWDWYIADSSVIDQIATDKPLIMSFSGRTWQGFCRALDAHHDKIVAVVWDYEPPGVTSQYDAELALSGAQWYAHFWYNLPFGVAVIMPSNNSLYWNGVDYSRGWVFADFLMPELYPPWYGNDPSTSEWLYWWATYESAVPVLPIMALQCSKAPITSPLSTQDMFANYFELSPKPEARAWWGLQNLGEPEVWMIYFIGHH